jgi:hypothetical protein
MTGSPSGGIEVFGFTHDGPIATTVFDSLPFPAFVVDADMRILAVNVSGRKLVGAESGATLRVKGGEAWMCVNSEAGCGQSRSCPDCMLRTNVTYTSTSKQSLRTRAKLEVHRSGQVDAVHALLTTSPIRHEGQDAVLVLLEDLAMLFALGDVLPVCMGCRKVRDNELWMQIEGYLDAHLNLKLSQGLCPECSLRLDHESDAEHHGGA